MIRRTVVVKLAVPDERRDDLRETTERFRQAAQMVANRAFERDDDGYVITSKTKLHEFTYQQVREATDGLNADLVCAARNYAADSVKGVTSAWQNGKYAMQPAFTANTVVYNKNAVTYRDDRCTLAAVNGRVKAEYVLSHRRARLHRPSTCETTSGSFGNRHFTTAMTTTTFTSAFGRRKRLPQPIRTLRVLGT